MKPLILMKVKGLVHFERESKFRNVYDEGVESDIGRKGGVV